MCEGFRSLNTIVSIALIDDDGRISSVTQMLGLRYRALYVQSVDERLITNKFRYLVHI